MTPITWFLAGFITGLFVGAIVGFAMLVGAERDARHSEDNFYD